MRDKAFDTFIIIVLCGVILAGLYMLAASQPIEGIG